MFFPVGEFRLGDFRICKTDPRAPPIPAIGEELVVSVMHRFNVDEALLEAEIFGGRGYITVHNDGEVRWPHGLAENQSDISRDELRAWMERFLP